jgi:hypothetical protein
MSGMIDSFESVSAPVGDPQLLNCPNPVIIFTFAGSYVSYCVRIIVQFFGPGRKPFRIDKRLRLVC